MKVSRLYKRPHKFQRWTARVGLVLSLAAVGMMMVVMTTQALVLLP